MRITNFLLLAISLLLVAMLAMSEGEMITRDCMEAAAVALLFFAVTALLKEK